ncbi:hypothetical protein CerSpe_175930 [Prunus speciosa]
MYKSRLHELCQHKKWPIPEYKATKLGLDHNPRFSASVTINRVTFDTVELFMSSKEAQNDAARLAFTDLQVTPYVPLGPPVPPPPPSSTMSQVMAAYAPWGPHVPPPYAPPPPLGSAIYPPPSPYAHVP